MMKTVEQRIGGRTVRLQTAGQGEPLLYLHGFEGPLGADAAFFDKLAARYTVYAPEHPGYGKSDGLDDMHDITDLVLHYRRFIETLGGSRVVLMGHSLGGMFAAEIAAFCPHLVNRLMLVDAYGLWLDAHPMPDPFVLSKPEMAAAKWGGAEAAERFESLGGGADDAFRQQNLGAATRFMWPIPDRGLVRRLAFIQAPTLVLHGALDGLVPKIYAQVYADGIAGARPVLLEECGHMPMIQAEAAFLREVEAFLP